MNTKPNSLSTLKKTIPKLYGRPKAIKDMIKKIMIIFVETRKPKHILKAPIHKLLNKHKNSEA